MFLLVSLSRCGSTALHRALNCHREIRSAFEPDVSACGFDASALSAWFRGLSREVSGIKHVWDPSGYPYRPEHESSLHNLEQYAEASFDATAHLLRLADRVLSLRRRNELWRVLSDLLGQQTGLWGPLYPDARLPHGVDEVAVYRRELAARPIRPLDLRVVDWYMAQGRELERRLRAECRPGTCLDLFYEDVFRTPDTGLDTYRAVLDFVGVSTEPSRWPATTVRRIFSPSGKLNNRLTLERIPNLASIMGAYADFSLDELAHSR